MLGTSVRLLRLLTLLQVRRDWSGADLAERLGVTTRTVRNDVERLRILGYEVRSRTGVTGGYRLAAGSALPPLLLDDDEAVAVALGLRAAAAGSVTGIEETSLRALAKLERTLPARLRHRLDALRQATVSAAGGGPTVDADTLTTIAATCRDHEVLRFDYTGHDGDASPRRVEPHRLVYTGRRWYLLAWDRDRADWRTFRADRIRPRLPAGPRFTPREPPEDAARHVMRGVASTAWAYPARVRLHAPAEVVAEHDRVTPAAGLLTPVDEHSCILETGSGSLRDLVGYLTGLDVGFDVLDPPELRTLLRELAERYAAAAAQRDTGDSDGAPVLTPVIGGPVCDPDRTGGEPMTTEPTGTGTRDDPWQLVTPPGTSSYLMFRDETLDPPALVCRVGKTELRYHLQALDDLHAMLVAHGDWMPLGGADEQKTAPDGTVEAWARSADNPVGGWYGLKKGLRGRFGMYVPPVLEALGRAEVEHNPRNNRMRAI